MRPQHLKDLISHNVDGTADALLDALVSFFNSIVFPGLVPEFVRPIFYGAKLFALSKKDSSIRPIAIGLTLRRLAGKLCMGLLQDFSRAMFRPYQLGVAVPNGCEIAVHSARKFVDYDDQARKAIVKVDYVLPPEKCTSHSQTDVPSSHQPYLEE